MCFLTRKLKPLLLSLGVLTACYLPLTETTAMAAPVMIRAPLEEMARVVVIELIDTHADRADELGIVHDGDNIQETFERGFQQSGQRDRLIRVRLEGDRLTPEQVHRTLHDLVRQGLLRPCDTLLIYYSGHGSWRRDFHVLNMAHGNLFRDDLVQAMTQTGCRLRVLLTDCCSSATRGPADRSGDKLGAPAVQANAARWNTIRDLLLRHQGMVDITAALPGTPALGNPVSGGTFTHLLLELMRTPIEELDLNGDGQVDWEEIFEKLKHGAANQQAYPFSIPKKPKI